MMPLLDGAWMVFGGGGSTERPALTGFLQPRYKPCKARSGEKIFFSLRFPSLSKAAQGQPSLPKPLPQGGGRGIRRRPYSVRVWPVKPGPRLVKASPIKSKLVQPFFRKKKIVYFLEKLGGLGVSNPRNRRFQTLTSQMQTGWTGKLNKKNDAPLVYP